MTGAILFFIAVFFLLTGFVLGSFKKPKATAKQKARVEHIAAEIKREYENFLSYDGTEQV